MKIATTCNVLRQSWRVTTDVAHQAAATTGDRETGSRFVLQLVYACHPRHHGVRIEPDSVICFVGSHISFFGCPKGNSIIKFDRGIFGSGVLEMDGTNEFATVIAEQIIRADKQGRPHIEINAGEVHRMVGGYPAKLGSNHAMASCCNAMWNEFSKGKGEVIFRTRSGQSASLTLRFYLPRPNRINRKS
jgi:5-methylcytosine-specific restriction protein A